MSETLPPFSGGVNIAMKLPPHLFDDTLSFYRDTLRLPLVQQDEHSCAFQFGPNRLWLDRVPAMSQAELWLELLTPDTERAADYLAQAGVVRCDEIEPLPPGFDGFWISSPAQIIHIVAPPEQQTVDTI
jgi:hypothetical protein